MTTNARGTADKITILTTLSDILATKRHTLEDDGSTSTESYGRAKNFRWRQEKVASLKDIHRILQGLSQKTQCFVIRGEPLPGVQKGDKVSRRNKTSKDGEAPHWQAADPGRRWVAFDFDELKPERFLSNPPTDEDLRAVAEDARRSLPVEFRTGAAVYKYSASTGILGWDTVSLHLWFWLDRAICDYSIREWAKGKIDPSLYKPVQPHYTADPVCEGFTDPLLGQRIGMLPGTDVTTAPAAWLDLPTWRARLEATIKPAPIPITIPEGASLHDIEDARRQYAAKALEKACASIQAQSKGGRHDTAFKEAYAVGGYVGAGYLDRNLAESSLISAIQSVVDPSRHGKEADSVREGIALGVGQPRSLDHVGRPHLALVPPPDPASAPVAEAPEVEPAPAAGSRAAMGLPDTEDQKMAPFCSGLTDSITPIVADVAKGAPVDGHVVPHGYWLHGKGTGLWKSTPQGTKYPTIEAAPIVVTATDEDIETGIQRVRIAWRHRGRKTWTARWIPRQDALSKRGLERWIGNGFPVTSESAAQLVGYIRAYMAQNADKLPHLRTTSALGWQGRRGELGFMAGRRHIVEGGGYKWVDLDDPKTWLDDHIAFRAAESDAGGEQIADAIRDGGNFDAWRKTITRLESYPLALVGVIASLAAPLVEIVNCPNFILDWAFRTSSGKTTILQAAASVWADPSDQSGFIRSWMATATNIERTAVTLRSIPLLMDDTAQAKHPDIVSGAIYDLCKGTSKPRGTKTGTEAVSHFRLPVLSTGEQPATSFGEKGGAKARCLEIADPPFGGESVETGVFVRDLKLDLLANYGHGGPRFVSWLLKHRDQWPEFRANFVRRVRVLSAASTSGAASRTCETRALLELTLDLVEQALGLVVRDPIPHAWIGIASEVDDAAGEERALSRVVGWFASNRERFLGQAKNVGTPSQGWLGVVVRGANATAPFVGFDEAHLSKFLGDQGFNYRAMIKGWLSRGWLIRDEPRLTRMVRMNGGRTRVIALPLEMFTDNPEHILSPPSPERLY